MNTRDFSKAMSAIDNKYIEEAINYKKQAKSYSWVKWGAAACFFVFAAIFSILPNYIKQQGIIPPDEPNGITTDNPIHDTPPAASEIHISMENIFVNDIAELSDAVDNWYDSELYDNVVWDKEAVIKYYGKDLTPVYIPDGLIAAPGNGTAAVIISKDGHMVSDTIWLNFYHDYYEDGSPKLTENAAACKGFFITASRIGLLNDCIYLLPENEVKTSDIGGTAVTFGYRSMPYGSYDPKTHEPSGYYDMYVAEFEHGGTQYQIVAEQMELEELIKVVSSIIYGKKEIVIYR